MTSIIEATVQLPAKGSSIIVRPPKSCLQEKSALARGFGPATSRATILHERKSMSSQALAEPALWVVGHIHR